MPHNDPRVREALHAGGRRLTVPRARILEALHRLPGHATAEQIHALVRAEPPGGDVALSTVYRNLDALVEMGLVTAFDGGGVTMYEWAADAPHHHLLCDGCGGSREVALPSLDALCAEVQREHGFTVDLRHLALRGRCARCRPSAETTGVSGVTR